MAPLSPEPPRFAARVRTVKRRFANARSLMEQRARGDGVPARDYLHAVGDLLRIAIVEVPRLVRTDVVAQSPIAAEIAEEVAKVTSARHNLRASLPRWFTARDEAFAGIVDLLTAYSRVLARLSMLGRPATPDWLGGLDPDAVFPSYRYSASNRGRVPRFTEEPPEDPKVWRVQIGGLIWPSAIIDRNGDLYTGHADNEMVALHPDGTIKWRLEDAQMMYVDSTGALGRDGFLYMASTDTDTRGHQNQGRIWKIDPATGGVVWEFWGTHFDDPEDNPQAHLSSFMEGNVALSEENGEIYVYAGSDDNRLYKLDSDGKVVWDYDVDWYPAGIVWTKPLFDPECSVVYIGDLAGQVHAVRTSDGTRIWAVHLGGAVVSSLAHGLHGELFLGCFDGRVYALDAEDGSELWSYQTLGLVYSSAAVTEDGGIVIGSSDGAIYCLDRFGRRRWMYVTDAPVKSSPVIDPEGNSYVGNQNGKIYCIDKSGERVWSYDTNPKVPENDINASPTLGASGTVYVGSSTGEIFAIDPGYCEAQSLDPAVSLDPGDDGARPDIPPGGAVLVHLDRFGTPIFDTVPDAGLADNLNFALFAVDENLDVVESVLLPDGLDVAISPDLTCDVRVESMGRYLYILPQELLHPDTTYEIHIRARYRAGGERRNLEAILHVTTTNVTGDDSPGLAIGGDSVTAFVIHSARASMPKEIDAVGQAMIDSQNFIVAPLHVDPERHRFVAAVAWAHQRGDIYEYQASTVNKMVVAGYFRDGFMYFEGHLHLIAQGINIDIRRLRFGGRVSPPQGLADGSASLVAPVDSIPEFTDLLRGLGLADDRDEACGFLTFSTDPWEGDAARRPGGVEVEAHIDGSTIVVVLDAPGVRAADHWLQIVIYDRVTGRVHEPHVELTLDGAGAPQRLSARIPEDVLGGQAVAMVAYDLYPLTTVEI